MEFFGRSFRLFEFTVTLAISFYSLSFIKKHMKNEFKLAIHIQIMEIASEVLNDVINENFKMKYGVHYYDQYDVKNSIRMQAENDYCVRSDAYKYFHPDIVLKDLYVIREIAVEIPKQIIREHTFDPLPFLGRYLPANVTKAHKTRWPIQTSVMFMHYEHLNNEFVYGKQILCLFQKYNHIPGKFSISHKNNLMDNFHRQLDKLKKEEKPEICMKNASYLPQTYRLYNQAECSAFFRYLNSSAYQEALSNKGPQFITKAGQEVHRGRGITVIFKEESEQLKETYWDGQRCGIEESILIAQRYISDPYLYKGHKIEFRIYFMITSTYPLIVHAYKKALIKRCAKPFSINSTEKASHVCNTAIVKSTIEKLDNNDDDDIITHDGNDENNVKELDQSTVEEEEFFIDWYLEGLQELLLQQKRINSTNWLEEYLYPQVYKQIIHLVRSGQYKFYKDSRVSEFFAVDFLLNEALEIFILECNYNPQILSVTPERIRRNYKMVQDSLEVLQAYTRSRYIRIKKLIKKVLQQATQFNAKFGNKKQLLYQSSAREYIQMVMKDDKYKSALFNAFRERLEDRITISAGNLYEKIIDENLKGPEAYHNLIQNECL